jgi:hypothetical protein
MSVSVRVLVHLSSGVYDALVTEFRKEQSAGMKLEFTAYLDSLAAGLIEGDDLYSAARDRTAGKVYRDSLGRVIE